MPPGSPTNGHSPPTKHPQRHFAAEFEPGGVSFPSRPGAMTPQLSFESKPDKSGIRVASISAGSPDRQLPPPRRRRLLFRKKGQRSFLPAFLGIYIHPTKYPDEMPNVRRPDAPERSREVVLGRTRHARFSRSRPGQSILARPKRVVGARWNLPVDLGDSRQRLLVPELQEVQPFPKVIHEAQPHPV